MGLMRWLAGTAWLAGAWLRASDVLPGFDFTRPEGRVGWSALHDIASVSAGANGLEIVLGGGDPYLAGPARDYPEDVPLWMHVRIRSEASGPAQVFYFHAGPSEERSVRFHVKGGEWRDVRVPVPPLGKGMRLRLDPPGASGTCLVAGIRFERRPRLEEPAWPRPSGEKWVSRARLRSGDVEWDQGPGMGQFEVHVAGELMATGHDRLELGHRVDGATRWTAWGGEARVERRGGAVRVTRTVTEPDGGRWEIEQSFRASRVPGGIDFEVRVGTTRERDVVHLPLMVVLPGAGDGGFGAGKGQGLLAGLEYLEDEPSSSEADIVGPASRRRVPDPLKVTFPLAALSARGRCVGMMWESGPGIAVLHDSPDRVFGSGGHVMGLVFPGAEPVEREDGSLMPYGPRRLRAGEVVMARGTIVGGKGETVTPAVQGYVARRGLPGLPGGREVDLGAYVRTVAKGWLRSEIRDGSRFRHAVGPGFGSVPAADAVLGMMWLAERVGDAAMAAELRGLAAAAAREVPPHRLHASDIGHVRHPALAPLVLGELEANVADAIHEGRRIVEGFGADGALRYRAPAVGPDLGRTHGTTEANGLAGAAVARLLELAAFTGDSGLKEDGLRLLRGLRRFRGTVPRGAQTWEVPLHAPDILASAQMVRAWTLGYELTGDAGFIGEAREWAWTGVPFVYLTQPVPGPAGVYGTVPVLGATQFIAPVWLGLPVQWCGLVYGDAIRRLARHDPGGPWLRMADGIAMAGIQHTAASEKPWHEGLLPDSYDLRAQAPNPVPINPATLFPEAIQGLGEPAMFDLRRLGQTGWIVHAPGTVRVVREGGDGATIRVEAWPSGEWRMLVDGLVAMPTVRVDGRDVLPGEVGRWDAATGRLVLVLRGRPTVELRRGR